MNELDVTENIWITLGDGRRLAARVWMPAGEGPFPGILEYLPYRKRDGTVARDDTTHPVFAREGYACLRVDIAGTGESEGTFDDEYSEQELRDGEEILAWIAAQDWCDGAVGMIGISWGGFNGLQLAYRRPPALKAVVTVASTVDRYADDIHYMGGCLLVDNPKWAATMFAYLSRPADPELRADWRKDWIARMAEQPFLAAEWLRHSTRGAFWKHGSVCEDWSRIEVPVLAITGWADAYVNTPAALLENLQCPVKALLGPWEHRVAHLSKLGAADYHSEVVGWFDRYLKGDLNGAEDLPAYRVFMQEHFGPTSTNKPREGRWIAEAVWPSPHVSARRLHLGPEGLGAQRTDGEAKVSSPAHLGMAAGYFCPGMRVDNELAGDQAGDDALSTCFDSEPLPRPLELLGRPVVEIAFSVDRPMAQIVARLCDVSPDGVSQRITYRPFNLTHHKSHEHPSALEPGRHYHARIALNECAHRLRAGHRLRLALSSSYWPIVWPSPEHAEITLHTEACALELPVRDAPEEVDPANPGPPQEAPPVGVEYLRPPLSRSDRKVEPDGTVTLTTFDDFGETRSLVHGLETGSHVTERCSIHPDDPTSARFETEWTFTYARGDWRVEIVTANTMTGDTENFHLHRALRATEGVERTEVLTKEWSETIPRGFL